MDIRIRHVEAFEPGFYCGRGSPLGNRFVIGKDGTRAFATRDGDAYLLSAYMTRDDTLCIDIGDEGEAP